MCATRQVSPSDVRLIAWCAGDGPEMLAFQIDGQNGTDPDKLAEVTAEILKSSVGQ